MKGQYFTLDVIVAGVVALMVIVFLLNYWQYALDNNVLYKDSLNKEAIRISQMMFSKNGEYSLVNKTSPAVLKAGGDEKLYSIIDNLNKSVFVSITVYKNNKLLYGNPAVHYPEAKISRVAYDPSLDKPVDITIHVSRS